ncbi:MAG: sugar O-acetyltransferase [Clostridia bacterium]|nr:sugar O-acetyltransferase [Clostridia bacterium]
MDNRKRMIDGQIYDPNDEKILSEQFGYVELLYEFNSLPPSRLDERKEIMKKMLGKVGENCYIEPPFHANWGGKHVYMGNNVYANFNLTLVDDGNIYIGDNVLFGPNVTVATASHPLWPELRAKGFQFNKDVHIGNNVWIGAGSVIVPGVSIGDNTVIGAGSVVTKDIPANCLAFGSPCKIRREITESDRPDDTDFLLNQQRQNK